jgi:hypothetical protein
MNRTTTLLATALVTLAGCAQTPGDDASNGTGGKADGTTTKLTFSDDFSETASGPLIAGDTIRVDYDVDRLTACRGSTNGSDVWSITGWAKFGTAAPKQFALTRLEAGRAVALQAELEIPSSATSVELWFTNNNRWGCNAYDSNEGANYAFDVEQRGDTAVLAFDSDFSENQSAEIHELDTVVIHYAPERLARCAGSTGGHAAWSVTGFYQVDGGAVKQVMVTRAEGSTLVAADPQITVPHGHDLALWFEATSIWGCHDVDSDYGDNYHFAIE